MISGRAAYAVLAAFLIAVVLLLAAPAWSQDRKDPGRAGDAVREALERERGQASGPARAGEAADDDSNRARSEASRKDSKRSRDATVERSSKRDKNNASSKRSNSKSSNGDPVDGQEVIVQKDGPDQGRVDTGDVLMIPGNYEVSSGVSITIKDQSSHEDTFDNQNADITDTNNGDVKIAVDDDTDLVSTDRLRVVTSDGIRANRFGRRGGGGACRQNIDIGSLQYQPIEQICIIERGGSINRRVPPFVDDFEEIDFFEELEDLLQEDDEEVVVRVQPDGVVADTSTVSKLPFTGGPGFAGVAAVIAALALLGAGIGVVLLRLGRGRSGD